MYCKLTWRRYLDQLSFHFVFSFCLNVRLLDTLFRLSDCMTFRVGGLLGNLDYTTHCFIIRSPESVWGLHYLTDCRWRARQYMIWDWHCFCHLTGFQTTFCPQKMWEMTTPKIQVVFLETDQREETNCASCVLFVLWFFQNTNEKRKYKIHG